MKADGDVRILIVEDELIIAEDIRTTLAGLGYNVTGVALNADEAETLLAGTKPDLVMLDIRLGGARDGIDLAAVIREKYRIPFIFLTSYGDRETVERAGRMLPDGYLLKPFTDRDLFAAIEMALFRRASAEQGGEKIVAKSSGETMNDCIFIKKDYLLIKVRFTELLWITSDGNYLELHCSGGKRHLIRSTLRDFLHRLPESLFLQVHKSFAVNINHIEAIEYNHLIIGADRIPVGRQYADTIRNILRIDF